MNQRLQALQELVEILEREALCIREDVDSETLALDSALTLGRLLARTVKSAGKALEPIKGMLRDVALAQDDGAPGPRHFTGKDGSRCTVLIPNPSPRIRKGLDPEELRSHLGEAFDVFFSTKVSPSKGFNKAASTHPLAKVALAAVNIVDGTPRVSFKETT